jgi:hypothetical protein
MNSKIAKSILLATLSFLIINCQETIEAAAEHLEIAVKTRPANMTAPINNVNSTATQQIAADVVVRNLYKIHTPNKSILGSKSRTPLDKFFDKNLADLIWKDLTTHTGEVGVIDFDPFYNAQDFDIKNLVVGHAKINGTKATVPVSFTNYKRKNLLTYLLVKQNGNWKMNKFKQN